MTLEHPIPDRGWRDLALRANVDVKGVNRDEVGLILMIAGVVGS